MFQVHLILSLLLLFLTVYPYLINNWSVASIITDKFKHDSIDQFDIINTDDIFWSRLVSTREIKESAAKSSKEIHIHSLGRKFKLLLNRPANLITNDFTVVTIDGDGRERVVPLMDGDSQIYVGVLDGDDESEVSVSVIAENNLLMAEIKTRQDIILIEPTYLHKDNLWSTNSVDRTKLHNDSMIVYRLQDHREFNDNGSWIKNFDPDTLCKGLHANDSNVETPKLYRFHREIPLGDQGIRKTRTRCTLQLVADYLFFKNVGRSDMQTTINYLLALVNRINQIYLPTVWETGNGDDEKFSNIGFTVQNIMIHREYTRLSSGEEHYNMQSNKTWRARDFLDNFSRHSPPRHYCLAHLLTYRQFDSPVLGLAYVASTRFGNIGGICSPAQHNGDAYYKHNTGISTGKGISNETLITRQADLVVAHELGHNLGAEHDSNECRPASSKGGAYLMHPFAVMGFEKNNRFLSSCSRKSIGRVIETKGPSCFVEVFDHVCGNGVVEDKEECDGGDIGHDHNDPCCDRYCRFVPGAHCSDRNSWCCSKCQIVPAGISCKPADNFYCKQESYCDGRSSECPAPPAADDGVNCINRGSCRAGECIPFCEARNLHSCLCSNQVDACSLCCQSSINSTCIPYGDRAIKLQDGVSCYKGICEKGRCEQPIQDVIQRLWDVLEDVNFPTIFKFLRNNIILVVLVITIPIWCVLSYYINEFDRRVKREVMNAISMNTRKGQPSPFLPTLFVRNELIETLPEEEQVKTVDGSDDMDRPEIATDDNFYGKETIL